MTKIQENKKEYSYESETFNSLREIKNTQLLTKEEEANLLKRVQKQDTEARSILIEKNLRLVKWVAKGTYSKYKLYHLSLNDLIQEGTIGLIKAIDKFDPEKNYKLSGYAVPAIERHIVQAIENQEKTIRIPTESLHQIYNYRENLSALKKEMNRTPTREELAQKMNTTVSKIRQLEQVAFYTISTNQPIKIDKYEEMVEEKDEVEGIVELEYTIPENNISIEEQIEQRELPRELEKCLKESNLSEYELDCFILYHMKGFTLEKIGKKYDVSPQRINQILKRALNKLRASENIAKLAVYLEDSNSALKKLENPRKKRYNKAIIEQQYRDAAAQYLKMYPNKTINDIKPHTTIILKTKKRVYIGRRLCRIREIIEGNKESELSKEQYEYWINTMGLSVQTKPQKYPVIQQNELDSMLEIQKLSQQLPLSFDTYLQINSLLKQIDLDNLKEGIKAKKITLKTSRKEQITKKELLNLIKHTFLTAKLMMSNHQKSTQPKRKVKTSHKK